MINSSESQLLLIKKNIIIIPDYPKKGILFHDISMLLANPNAYASSIDLLVFYYKNKKFNKILGIEARGFLFSAPLAIFLKLGLVLARKLGKLPRNTIQEKYYLEYETGCLEIHNDSITAGDKVLIVDDILATGGTIAAAAKLIRRLGGEVIHAAFIINLEHLNGKTFLDKIGINSYSLINYCDY